MRDVVSSSLSQQLNVTLFLPVLDAMLSELERRFSDKNLMHIKAIQACAPGSPHFWKPIILLLLLILMASIKVLFPWSVP